MQINRQEKYREIGIASADSISNEISFEFIVQK